MMSFLKIFGIVVASLIVLILLIISVVLFVPFRYKIYGTNKEYITAGLRISFLLSIFRITIYYKDLMGYVRFRFFGIKIFDNTFPELVDFFEKVSEWFDKLQKNDKNKDQISDSGKEENETSENNENNGTETEESEDDKDLRSNEDSEVNDLTDEELSTYLNDKDEFDELNGIQKNRRFFGFVKDWVLNIKKKWYNFKEFVDTKIKQWNKFKKEMKFYWKVIHYPSFQPTLILLKDTGIGMLKHVFPKKLRVSLVYGDEDYYVTAKVLSYCYMLMGMFGDNFEITPVWGEQKFVIDGYVKGRIRMAFMVSNAWKLFTNKHLRRMIILFRKGGNIRDRK